MNTPLLDTVIEKASQNQRISKEEALLLYQADLATLGKIANQKRELLHGDNTFFVRNFHIEPTNICIHKCQFCSYSARVTGRPWEFTIEEMVEKLHQEKTRSSELHITGGVHPEWPFEFYLELTKALRKESPSMHIKAFSAVEIWDMHLQSKLPVSEVLKQLKAAGLNALPGGGAEIFSSKIRQQICPDKASAEEWKQVHFEAHKIGIATNATMLYGHIESVEDRIDHLDQLRTLQDETSGFGCFIPLKFKEKENPMSKLGEVSLIEDLRTFAISRIYLDNFPHIKAYWPMLGSDTAQLLLSFGVDDLDGTINDSTEIYSRAGGEQNPTLSKDQLIGLITAAGRVAVER